jgi:hypothetical protein
MISGKKDETQPFSFTLFVEELLTDSLIFFGFVALMTRIFK